MIDPYESIPAPAFELTSESFEDGQPLPLKHANEGAGGQDITPQLSWGEVPEGTKSLALTCYDPDAPTASGFWHWAVANLPADLRSLEENAELPEGALVLANDGGQHAYMGAVPPAGHGPHRYIFAVHALDTEHLDLPETATPAYLGFTMFGRTLGRGQLTATFEIPADEKEKPARP